MTRIVMLEDYLDYAKQLPSVQALAARADLHIHTTKASSEAETVARTRDADIVVTIRDRVIYTDSLLAQLGHLKLLSVCGTRLSHIDLDAATRHGVLICAPSAAEQGSHTKAATAEQTWNLIMGLVKDTVMNDRALLRGEMANPAVSWPCGQNVGGVGTRGDRTTSG